jgi:thiol:disulfide interchange protein DsbC
MSAAPLALRLALQIGASLGSIAVTVPDDGSADLRAAAAQAEAQLHQSFSNLKFDEFRLSPVHDPLYQAHAGGHVIYFAPKSGHLLFASVYDSSGVNLTALAKTGGFDMMLTWGFVSQE